MLGHRGPEQFEFFAGSLRDLLPDGHVLVRVDRVLDLSWLRGEVSDLYCPNNGRPGIDPEAALRLMLAGFLLGIVHDRKLMREAAVNLAIRWFAGFGPSETLPDHSSLTRIRQRWGAERFRCIFARTVQACIAAGIARGEVVHVDASLIRADVSWESLAVRHVAAIDEANGTPEDEAEKASRKTGKWTPPETSPWRPVLASFEPTKRGGTVCRDSPGSGASRIGFASCRRRVIPWRSSSRSSTLRSFVRS